MPAAQIKCPGGEIVHPVLSSSGEAVQCRIQGGLRPAKSPPNAMGGSQPAVCCDAYTTCRIWRMHVEIDRGPSTKRQRDQQFATPHRHA